jgi:flagellar biosynthesis component FlhA
MRYCPASPATLQELGLPAQALTEAPHPLTGEPGCWIQPDFWGTVDDAPDLELWDDPILYTIYHLESVLRRNLAEYLGIQEVENLLEQWEENDRGASLIQAALPDQAARYRFARVLRALVRERAPITRWPEILEVTHEVGLESDDVREAVRAIRLQLKENLPGNVKPAEQIKLPSKVEEELSRWLQHLDGKAFLALPPEETQEALSEIRELVGSNVRNAVLVTQSGELRPFVRRLVEIEFPDLMVLAEEELLLPDEGSVAAQPEDEGQVEGANTDA